MNVVEGWAKSMTYDNEPNNIIQDEFILLCVRNIVLESMWTLLHIYDQELHISVEDWGKI